MLNLYLTEAINVFVGTKYTPNQAEAFRESFSDGGEQGIRRTAETGIFMEGRGYFAPTLDVNTSDRYTVTSYPSACKNYWSRQQPRKEQEYTGAGGAFFPKPTNGNTYNCTKPDLSVLSKDYPM